MMIKPSTSNHVHSTYYPSSFIITFNASLSHSHTHKHREKHFEEMEVGKGGRSLMRPLLIVNFVVYLIVLGLAGWSLDKYIDGEQNHPHLGGNPSTSFMLIFALLAGVIGQCSVLVGFTHLQAWRSHSLATAAASAIIAWAITALTFGLVCKEVIMGGHRGKRLQTLEAFITISTLSQLLYLLLLHAGMLSSRYGPTYGSSS